MTGWKCSYCGRDLALVPSKGCGAMVPENQAIRDRLCQWVDIGGDVNRAPDWLKRERFEP